MSSSIDILLSSSHLSFKMTTRNLYPLDAVAANFLYAAQRNNKDQLAKTVSELVASDEEELARALCKLAWSLAPPGPQSRTCYDSQKNVFSLAAAILTFPSWEIPEPLTPPPPPKDKSIHTYPNWYNSITINWTQNQKKRFAQAVDISMRKQNFAHVAYLLSAIKNPCEILRLYAISDEFIGEIESTLFQPLVPRVIEHVLWVANTPPQKGPLPLAQKSGRSFSINPEACDRWIVPPSPPTELIGIPTYVVKTGTQFWKTLLEKYKITVVDDAFEGEDNNLELFYSEAFPNDIPDEWSNEERAKSHPQWTPSNHTNPWRTAFLLC
jgi:hypothetical protein